MTTTDDAPSLPLLAVWRAAEQRFDRAFGARANPLRQLGALAFLAFWLLALSGIWLFAVFDTSASGAYESIAALSRSPWSPGGMMRSLHRYAADAFVVFTILHLLREALYGRWRWFRRFSWWTGAALLPMIAVSAVGGFWLHWDKLGQFSAIATAEWLDMLPILSNPFARNFLGAGMVSDRLFSLFIFVHVGVPLLLLFGLWFHIQRISHAAVFPARALTIGSVAMLLVLGAVWPVTGQGAADLAEVPAVLSVDWILLLVHPLMYETSGGVAWALALGGWGALMLLPFMPPPRRREPVAVVDPANCNGCRRCFVDCPYAAITMTAHPSGRPGRQLAVVDPDLCASCGICAGSCPSSTPFRSHAELPTGIDMPQLPVGVLRRRLREGLEAMTAPRRIVVFSCEQGADAAPLAGADSLVLPLICTGQLPPSFVEYALRDGAEGVLVASCRETGCAFRLGARWTAERLTGVREPHLRKTVPADRVRLVRADAGETAVLAAALRTMREFLPQIKENPEPEAKIYHG
ncbi:MAG: hydrogenase iron-sulfur subunit [Rhodoferax sp.]|jgi:coenzyme F420-reducing hydrogenase delta subunit/ferredoxin|nr:hydrogenase iron-sulfur subunit [Rhodoferax sp.]MCL4740080.1 hydrogenase iron-sulfur subunit [Burkholderiaceae bacterium]MCP5287614.1 hydrogenase iron-sulfur subunit [Burkholderiaceae bacterium]